MIEQAKEFDSHIINNVDIVNTIDIMIDDITETYGEENVEKES